MAAESTSVLAFAKGDLIGRRWEARARVGQGTFCELWRARDRHCAAPPGGGGEPPRGGGRSGGRGGGGGDDPTSSTKAKAAMGGHAAAGGPPPGAVFADGVALKVEKPAMRNTVLRREAAVLLDLQAAPCVPRHLGLVDFEVWSSEDLAMITTCYVTS